MNGTNTVNSDFLCKSCKYYLMDIFLSKEISDSIKKYRPIFYNKIHTHTHTHIYIYSEMHILRIKCFYTYLNVYICIFFIRESFNVNVKFLKCQIHPDFLKNIINPQRKRYKNTFRRTKMPDSYYIAKG